MSTMDDSSQLAMQVALQTLKERCQSLQEKMNELEKENIRLRAQRKDYKEDEVLNDVDKLRKKIIELTEEKVQLKSNMSLVTSENRQLWFRLTQLAQVNKTLGTHLNKISDSLKVHNKGIPLNKSKTFTQEDIKDKQVELHDRISLELEDISLKLISSFAKEKSELEMQCSQMAEMQSENTSFGFPYADDDMDDYDLIENLEGHLSDLRNIQELLWKQKSNVTRKIEQLNSLESKQTKCVQCEKNREELEELESLRKWQGVTDVKSNTNTFLQPNLQSNTIVQSKEDVEEKVCPMCSQTFQNVAFQLFLEHVQDHFTSEYSNTFEMIDT